MSDPGVVVQRSRFSTFLKQLTGYRGKLATPLLGLVQPTFDINQRAPELDEEQCYWYCTPNSQAAVVGQISVVGVRCQSGQAVVDWIFIRQQAAVSTYAIGIAAEFAAGTVNAGAANNFLFARGSVFNSAQAQFANVQGMNQANVSSPISGQNINVDVPAGQGLFLPSPMQWVIQPAYALVVSPNVNNLPVGASFGGRWLADQL